jgi:hydrogenase maturation protease
MAEEPRPEPRGAPLPSPLVIGVGNTNRRDDGVGPEVVRRLRSRIGTPDRAVAFEGDGTGLLDLWEDATWVVVVDAVRSGSPPGTVHRIDAHGPYSFPSPATSSTHGLSVAEAVRLGRTLGRLPDRLVVYGVEGSDFEPGTGLTAPVEGAVNRVVESIVRELAGPPPDGPTASREVPHA